MLKQMTGGANRRVVHPCYQAWSYAALIRDYNEYVQDNEIGLYPCAYLHNYPRIENDPLDKEQYQDIMEETPAFTYGQTSNVYCRNDAGTNKKALCLIPAGTKVECFGYYTAFSGTKWLYVQFTLDGVKYTGLVCSKYLKK